LPVCACRVRVYLIRMASGLAPLKESLHTHNLRCDCSVHKYFISWWPYLTGMGAEWSCGIFVISLRLRRREALL
jgi:hypothetical protein